jgi:hypothetical protein
MEDFVKCHGCNRESIRQDIFNDLALAVREFGATESYKSVEEALTAFIKPETLSGSNKYKCDNCNSYQEAEKGLRFTELPYLLVIQLKRFTVDYSSGFRVKLNDTMTFPDYLDLNSYIYDPKKKPATPSKPKMSYASIANKKTPSTSKPETILENEDFPTLGGKSSSTTPGDADGWINKPPNCEEVQAMLKKGPYVYELFAIMIHQGSATGGHYFAYIKNLEQSRWLCFNDTQVKAIDLEEVKKSFGNTGWTSNTNAYLMIYRQIDAKKNQKFTLNSELPQHVKDWLRQWEDEENRQASEQQRIESMVKVRVVLNDPRQLLENSPYGAVENSFSRDSTGHDVLKYFCNRFGEMGIFCSPDSAILVPVNNSFNYTSNETFNLQSHIGEKSSYGDICFIMELKKEDFNLPLLDDSLIDVVKTIDILTVDISYNSVRMCKRLCVYENEPMESIRNRICLLEPKCNFDPEYPCRMIIDNVLSDDTPLRLIDDYNVSYNQVVSTRFSITRFYIDCGTADALKVDRKIEDFTQTQMCKIIEKQKYGIRMRVFLPSAADYRQAGLKAPSNNVDILQQNENLSSSPPVSPISKKFCQLGPLNETTFNSINNRISQPNCLYTTSSSSSQMVMSSNQPQCSLVNTLPMDRFVNSTVPADSPPTYDEAVYQDPRVSPIEGASTPSSLNVFTDNDMDIDCPGSANISPNVSDNEENRPPPYSELSPWQNEWETTPSVSQLTTANIDDKKSSQNLNLNSLFPKDFGIIYNDTYTYPEYTVDLVDSHFSDHFQCQCINLIVDSRQFTTKLIEWIARYLHLQPENIVLLKHYNENDSKGFEIHIDPQETVKSSFSSVARISVSLRVPTAENEKLIRVVDFDMNNDNAVDTWSTLFYVPASNQTTFGEFKEKCVKMLENAYAEKFDVNRLRIREITHSGAPILNETKVFSTRGHIWDNLVALQRLKPEEVVKIKDGINMQPIIVRRFCPSTVEILPPFEVLIPENDPQSSQILKKAIAEHAKIMPERVGFSEICPKGSFARWPFTKSASELYDMTFVENITLPNDFGGKLVYFVDKNEAKKNLTADDRHALKIRERVEANRGNTARRTERPLRIQMSSVSESEP